MTNIDWSNGLEPELDYMLTERPGPEFRESASIWLYDDNGEFGFSRIGIEAKGNTWDNHGFQVNFVTRAGRALIDGGSGTSHSPIGADGKASILGTGGLIFECIVPFQQWRVTYEGQAIDTTTQAMIDKEMDPSRRTSLKFELKLTMAIPGWVQDLRPEKLVGLTPEELTDAGLMGYGWRVEQLFRAEGEVTVDGETHKFQGTGNRIHRQSERPLAAFRGHIWQAALFPDGRAFALCTYPPHEDGSTYNAAYIYQDGKMYPAVVKGAPAFLKHLVASGEDVSFDLESELGTTQISGESQFNVFHLTVAEMPGFSLNQGGAKYKWDGQSAYGMLERSDWANRLI